jgi:hypothetical protein
MKSKVSRTLLATCALLTCNSFAAHLVINREVTLSSRHNPGPTLITRASNGDFIIAGSSDNGRGYAWATRVDSNGQLIWEHLAGRRGDSNDYGRLGASIYGAIDLPNQETLLCGVKTTGIALLIRVRGDGSVVDERQLDPSRTDGSITAIRCSRWGNGFAVIGKVSGRPKGTGWLVKLDAKTDFVWQKFADYFSYGDVMEAPNGGLFFISWSNVSVADVTSVARVDSTGALVFNYPLPADSSDWQLVHPLEPRSSVRVAYMLSQTRTDVVELDDRLRDPKHIWHLHDAGLKAAVEMTNGSITILGSQWHNAATAALTIVDRNGDSQNFLMRPPYASPWFIAAVQSGSPNELATIRQVGPLFQLAWISIK